MSPVEPASRLDQDLVEQAMLWMVRLQSGVCSSEEQRACNAWRALDPRHELAWQRLAGFGQGMRDSTAALPASGVRHLLHARNNTSRRTLLKGFAGIGLLAATGWGVRERVLLPELFSDYHTTTGERRTLHLNGASELQLDTRTTVDIDSDGVTRTLLLNSGRMMLSLGATPDVCVQTANGRVTPLPLSRLIVSHGIGSLHGTRVQMLEGKAAITLLHGGLQTLEQGRQLSFDSRQSQPASNVPATALAWTRGLLIAERTPLGEIVEELGRYRRGILRCDPAVAGLRVSGSFSIDQPEASLDLLARTLPVRIQRVFGYWATVQPA